MKTIKRILVVVILCVLVLFVSYSCHTGKRVANEEVPAFTVGWQDG